MKEMINGYEIKFNGFWNQWQVWHEEIGYCGWFTTFDDAKEYCLNG